MNYLSLVLKSLLVILLLLCLLQMPYAYYQFIRFAGMALFAWFAYEKRDEKNKFFVFIWIASALLINPFLKISLGREIWNVVDVGWALILVFSMWQDISAMRNKKTTNI